MKQYFVFNISGGAGKNILATSVVRDIKKHCPNSSIIVTSPHKDVWLNNPIVDEVHSREVFPSLYKDYIFEKNARTFFHDPYFAEDYFYGRKHLIEIWSDLCTIPHTTIQPELYLTQHEIESTKQKFKINPQNQPIFLIQTNGGAGQRYPISWARDLPLPIAEEVCTIMQSNGYRVIQLRKQNQPKLNHAESFSCTFREALALIALSNKRLFIDSFAQHAAAALNKPSVVVWIANNPKVFGHALHTNLVPEIPESFRHTYASFLEKFDITGALDQHPYDTDRLFSVKKIIESLNL